jgi:hypothetical protein
VTGGGEHAARPASPDSSERRTRPSRGTILATAGALIGVLVGLATLFDFFDRVFGDDPPATISTRIEDARLQPTRQSLGDFLREQGVSTDGISRADQQEQGLIFLVGVHLQGNIGKTLRLRWRLYGADGRALSGRQYDQILGEYEPAGQDHDRRAPFWLPYPPRPGRYYSRFTLIDGKGTPSDDFTSKAFVIKRVPR